jgi:hypothetical protein
MMSLNGAVEKLSVLFHFVAMVCIALTKLIGRYPNLRKSVCCRSRRLPPRAHSSTELP